MVQFPTFDGGAQYRFEITGRTREHMEDLAAQHGMRLDEWLDYAIRPKRTMATVCAKSSHIAVDGEALLIWLGCQDNGG